MGFNPRKLQLEYEKLGNEQELETQIVLLQNVLDRIQSQIDDDAFTARDDYEDWLNKTKSSYSQYRAQLRERKLEYHQLIQARHERARQERLIHKKDREILTKLVAACIRNDGKKDDMLHEAIVYLRKGIS
jgi:hypothetical protein